MAHIDPHDEHDISGQREPEAPVAALASRPAREAPPAFVRGASPLLPKRSIAGRSLISVIAIMTFLAALAAGAVEMVSRAASDWTGSIAREATIQLRPAPGRDMEKDLLRVADLAAAAPGVARARVVPRAESDRLLEPWLGVGADLSELPTPRIVVLELARGGRPDLAELRAALSREMRGASLDDHRIWLDRLSTMAGSLVIIGLVVVGLVFAATALAVGFATRAAVATSRDIVEVLHLVGADDSFLASAFQRRFLVLGAEGAAIGCLAAILAYAAAGAAAVSLGSGPSGDQIEALFGSFALSARGYAAIFAVAVLVAILTALTSRLAVRRCLDAMG